MKVSYNWLNGYLDGKLPSPEKLAELFSAHAFEVEGIEKVGSDTALDIKVLPDRAHYALCHRGIAREAAAIARLASKPLVAPQIAIDASVAKVSVKVEDQKLCPRYMARRVEGIRAAASPSWIRERLEAVGARSINTVVDATNYVMFDIGQPLHAFDADKVKGGITVRHAKAGERIMTLDNRDIALLESDLVIADEEGALAIAGVKGGKKAEVTADTRNIIIEAANFNPTAVRRTSTRVNLRNDSSKRFENEITSSLAEEAMARVTALILELSGGAKAGATTDIYPNPEKPWTVVADPVSLNAITGLALSPDDMADILTRLQCKVEKAGASLSITPPLDRLDLRIPEDIADEIGRMTGYDKLPSVETPAILRVPTDETFLWAEKMKNALASQGFSETLLYTLVPKGAFEVSYPLASDKSALRERLSPKLADSLVMNGRNADLLGLETIREFEIGKVFPKAGEKTSFALGVLQAKKRKGVTSESVLKEAIAALETSLGVSLEAKIEVGLYGAIAEMDFDALSSKLGPAPLLSDLAFASLPKDKKYKPFSAYPFIARDVALFVPSTVLEEEVHSVLAGALSRSAGALLVKGPDCFDRFEKEGKKSLAFRMIFQSFEKTLSDEDANSFMDAVYKALTAKGWEVR